MLRAEYLSEVQRLDRLVQNCLQQLTQLRTSPHLQSSHHGGTQPSSDFAVLKDGAQHDESASPMLRLSESELKHSRDNQLYNSSDHHSQEKAAPPVDTDGEGEEHLMDKTQASVVAPVFA